MPDRRVSSSGLRWLRVERQRGAGWESGVNASLCTAVTLEGNDFLGGWAGVSLPWGILARWNVGRKHRSGPAPEPDRRRLGWPVCRERC